MNHSKSLRSMLSAPLIAILALGFASTSAVATTATATFNVTATVSNSCTITAAALAFGAYTGAAVVLGTSNLTINCTNLASYSVGLSTGSGSFTTRTMTNGTSTLGYNLYTTAGDTVVWGDGTGSTAQVTGTGSGSNQTIAVNGKIPAGETSLTGTYTDTITATITY